MADTIAIRRRIRSVSSTRQITKAMQLVAASKMRSAVEAAARAQAYRQQLDTVLSLAATDPDWQLHPLVRPSEANGTRIVVIGSDRGLVGAYHARLEAVLKAEVAKYRSEGPIELAVVGRKEARMAARIKDVEIIGRYPGPGASPSIWQVAGAARESFEAYSGGKIGRIVIIATRFYSPLRQEAEASVLLPLATVTPAETVPPKLEPGNEEAIGAAIASWLNATFLDVTANAFASEQAMQMMAMQNATTNAGEMIDELTLAYNTARQAAITQELAEISGGVAALSS